MSVLRTLILTFCTLALVSYQAACACTHHEVLAASAPVGMGHEHHCDDSAPAPHHQGMADFSDCDHAPADELNSVRADIPAPVFQTLAMSQWVDLSQPEPLASTAIENWSPGRGPPPRLPAQRKTIFLN